MREPRLPGVQVNGNDVLAVRAATAAATPGLHRWADQPSLKPSRIHGPAASSDNPSRSRPAEEAALNSGTIILKLIAASARIGACRRCRTFAVADYD